MHFDLLFCSYSVCRFLKHIYKSKLMQVMQYTQADLFKYSYDINYYF